MRRQDPERDLGQPPFGPLGGDDQIAAIGHDAADPDGIAIDGGDEGFGEIRQQVHRLMPTPLRQGLDRLGDRVAGMRLRVLQIGAGAERAARLVAGQDDAADLVVIFDLRQQLLQRRVVILTPSVARLRPRQGQDRDSAAFLVQQGHGFPPT